MWGRLWKIVGDKQIQLECFWVKSHGDEHPEFFSKYDLSVHDSFGNCCADRLAIAAASAAEIPLHIANPVLKKISHTQLIQKRLVAILQELVVAFPRQGTATGVLKDIKGWRNVPQLPLSRVLFLSTHTPILGFKSGLCASCGSFVEGTIDDLRQWLLSPCGGQDYAELLQESVGKPVAVPPQYRVRVAGVVLHESHTLQVYKHLYFCVECGKVAGHRVQQLGEVCSPLGQGVVWGRQVPTWGQKLKEN